MFQEQTSKHFGGVTELTLVAPLKQGYLPPPVPQPMTYAARLRAVFATLYGIRKVALERFADGSHIGPLERLRILHSVRFTVFDHDTRLLLGVSFDGGWEPYIRVIAEQAGPLLDLIFCHCEDYAGHSSNFGYPKFAEWVRAHQISCDFFHPNEPGLSVDDVRYLKEFEQLHQATPRGFDAAALEHRVGTPRTRMPPQVAVRVLDALYALRPLFPAAVTGHERLDAVFLQQTTQSILQNMPDLGQGAKKYYAEALTWLGEDPAATLRRLFPSPTMRELPARAANIDDVQPHVFASGPSPTHGCLLLFQVHDPSQAAGALRELAEQAFAADREYRVTVGLTHGGIQRLVAQPALLAKLPKEFREGMAARAGLLGDLGPNHPDRWNLPPANGTFPPSPAPTGGVSLSCVDVTLLIEGDATSEEGDHLWSDSHPLYGPITECVAGMHGLELLSVQPLRRYRKGNEPVVEHFGYVDGISQPFVDGQARDGRADQDRVAVGEVLCGYPNARGEVIEDPQLRELLRNGSFMVIRKLAQNVRAFRDFVGENAELKAKIMGRTPQGIPLAGATTTPTNDFDFAGDLAGKRCPFRAHIRLANPRDGQPHIPRILRRGFSYGTRWSEQTDEDERGLLFMAYNASLADQFEVIQRWLAGGNSTGVLASHNDVFVGLGGPEGNGSKRVFRYLREDGSVARAELGSAPLVRLEWGVYVFVPSISMLRSLGKEAVRTTSSELDAAGDAAGTGANRPPPGEGGSECTLGARCIGRASEAEVKRRLEGDAESAAWEWAHIEAAHQGVLRTQYGVLCGVPALVAQTLSSEEHYSVRAYWQRMHGSIGDLWLGMDHAPRESADPSEQGTHLDRAFRDAAPPGRYEGESSEPNQRLHEKTRFEAFTSGYHIGRFYLSQDSLVEPYSRRAHVKLDKYGAAVVSILISGLLGLPDGKHIVIGPTSEAASCPADFMAVANSVFIPGSPEADRQAANARGQVIADAVRSFVEARVPGPEFLEQLRAKADSNEVLGRQVAGVLQGAVVATTGTLVKLLTAWSATGELWRLQQSVPSVGPEPRLIATDDTPLMRAIVRGMALQPVPDVLHRTATEAAMLGAVRVEPGERVIVGLGPCARRTGEKAWLFGGKYGATRHACPAAEWALGAIAGAVLALLEHADLRAEGPFELSFSPRR